MYATQSYEIVDGKLVLHGCKDNRWEGSLDLSGCNGLTYLPENLSVGGSLDLYCCTRLTALPENLFVGGSLSFYGCNRLTYLPENLSVGESLDLSCCTGLTSLPDNLSVGESLYLYYCTWLTVLPDNLSVGGSLHLSGCTGLTVLPENLSVGEWLDLSGCTGLTSLPENLSVKNSIYATEILRWKGRLYSFFDGVEKIIKSHRGNVYRCDDGTYIVTDGQGNYSHGKTLAEAKDNLVYKITTRDLSEFEWLTLDSEITHEQAIKLYRSVTGACSYGTRCFVEANASKVKPSYTIKEIIDITNGAYGSDAIKKFFKSKKTA